MMYKKCSICKKIKSLDEFHKKKKSKDGYNCQCKLCKKIISKEYYIVNKKRFRLNSQKLYLANREKRLLKQKKYWFENKGKFKKYFEEYNKEYYKINRDKILERTEEYRQKPENKKRLNKIRKNKRKVDFRFRLDKNIGTAIWKALKEQKNGRHWEILVGYTIQDLISHLEKQFESWMSWDNYGKWHIDHKKPISLFNYKKEEDEEFKKCWALKNLQPLEAIENIRKSNKYNFKVY